MHMRGSTQARESHAGPYARPHRPYVPMPVRRTQLDRGQRVRPPQLATSFTRLSTSPTRSSSACSIRRCEPVPAHQAAPVPDPCAGPVFRPEFQFWNNLRVWMFPSIVAREAAKMLTMLATFAAPVVVLTILIIVACEIRDAWDRNRVE